MRTYIQSGNVIFRATPDLAAGLPAKITAAIAKRFGHAVPLLLRTVDEIDGVLSNNPFAYFDSKPATTSTDRNWRTVTKLYELANC